MKTNTLLVIILLWFLHVGTAFPATVVVEIRNFYFTPTNILIQPGDTVTWRNTSFTPHDSTHRPATGRLWASPVLAQNETFSFTFSQPGDYPYMCALHVANFLQQTGTVSVVAVNIAPTVTIASPAAGAVFAAPATFNITADADDLDGSVVSVQFLVNGAPLSTSTGPQFTATAMNLPAGSYPLTAVATDDKGAVTASAPVTVFVNELASYPLNVSVEPVGSGSVSVDPPQPVGGYASNTVVTVTAAAVEGFAFSGWNGDASGTQNPLMLTMNAPKEVAANFVEVVVPTFALHLVTNPLGSGAIQASPAPNAANGRYTQGSEVMLTAWPAPGFAFSNWVGGVSGASNPVTVVLDEDKNVTASFVQVLPTIHALIIGVSPAGSGKVFVTPATSNQIYASGSVVALSAQPGIGFQFIGWTGATTSTNNPIPLLMDADKVVTARFEPISAVSFAKVRGAYAGLLVDEAMTNFASAGFLTIRVLTSGAFRGMATLGGMKERVDGQFDRFGYAPLVLRRGTLSGWMQMDSAGISGVLAPGNAAEPAPALRLYRTQGNTNAFPYAGSYSLSVAAAEPVGQPGAVSMTVSEERTVRLHGNLGDGSTFRQRTIISDDGRVPLFALLQQRHGAILGWIDLSDSGTGQGSVSWFRPGNSRHPTYPDGFTLRVPITGTKLE